MIRGAGLACLFLACLLCGARRYIRYCRELRLLVELEHFFLRMKSEIHYAKSDLPEFFRKEAARETYGICEWIRAVSDGFCGCAANGARAHRPFSRIWDETARQKLAGRIRNAELWRAFLRLGEELGGMDMQSQTDALALFLLELADEIKEQRLRLPVRQKLCLSLGVMAGMFLCVLLI